MDTKQIAIDGPAGAGKSSVAKRLAKALNYIYLDTGAMYRSMTYCAIKNGLALEESPELKQLVNHTVIEFAEGNNGEGQIVYCNGENVTEAIRTTEISNQVSRLSALPLVRQVLVQKQQDIARKHNVVMDGRDIGTVVLPNAEYKFFLTASLEARAKRRLQELEDKGFEVSFEQLCREMESRDKQDSERAVSPLVAADDAIHIDTSHMSLEEVVEKLLTIIKK